MSVQLPPPSSGNYGSSEIPADPNANLAATGNTTGATSTSIVVSLSSDTLTVYNELGSQAALAFSVNGQVVDFTTPILPPSGDYSTLNLSMASTGNKWLDTAVQVTLILMILETAKIQAENQLQEALLSRDQVQNLFQLGMEAADLILQKAEKEKQQYMALAIAGFASMAMAVAGAATSIAGAAKSYKASGQGIEASRLESQAKQADIDGITTDNAGQVQAGSANQNARRTGEDLRNEAEPYRKSEREYNQEASRLTDVGRSFTQSASSVNDILQNSIKAMFVGDIAQTDYLKQYNESMQNVTRHAQENATQAARDLGDSWAQLLQLAQKIADANAQNFTINAHGSS